MTVYAFIASEGKSSVIVSSSDITDQHREWIAKSHANYRKMQNSSGRKEKWPAYEFYLEKQGDLSCMHVFYLPKYIDLSDVCITWLEQANVEQLKACHIAIKRYLEFVDALHRPIERRGLSQVFGIDGQILDLQMEIDTVKTLWNYLKKRRYIEEEYICSDVILGEIDTELNMYHTDLHTKIQRVEVSHKQIYEIVNSYIHQRYTGSILEYCQNERISLPKQLDELIFQLRKLKAGTKYAGQKRFLTKRELLNRRQIVLKRDRKLYKLLEQLRQYHAWDTSNLVVQHVLNMPHTWEQYLYKYTFDEDSDYHKPSAVFLKECDTKNKNKTKGEGSDDANVKKAEPEYVDENAVYDAKYKRLDKFSITKVSDSDINKLLRDMLVYNRKHGVLVYPTPMTFLGLLRCHGLETGEDWYQSETHQISIVREQRAGLHSVRMSYVPFVVIDDSTPKMLNSYLKPFANIKWDLV